MSTTESKRHIYERFAEIGRALGHEHRLELLEQLGQGEWSVEELAQRSGLSFANASQHLHMMRRCGLVKSRKAGRNVFFGLADGPVFDAVVAIRNLAEHNLADVRALVGDFMHDPDQLAPLSLDELRQRLADGDIVLLDVRDNAEYLQGHLPGAVHIPHDQLGSRLDELPSDREIVAYCRGRYCILSHIAVETLRRGGFRSRRAAEGFVEWKASGEPVLAG